MSSIRIVPATFDHIAGLDLRAEDAAEVAAFGVTKEWALRDSIGRSVWAETYLVDGVPAAIVGLGRSALLGGHGVPWALTAPAVERHARFLLRESRRQVARMRDEAAPLVNYVHAGHRRALPWLRWLGFTIEPAQPMARGWFHRFVMEA